jgi:hypothetical protein
MSDESPTHGYKPSAIGVLKVTCFDKEVLLLD